MKYRIKTGNTMDLRLLTLAAVVVIATIDSGDILAVFCEFYRMYDVRLLLVPGDFNGSVYGFGSGRIEAWADWGGRRPPPSH